MEFGERLRVKAGISVDAGFLSLGGREGLVGLQYRTGYGDGEVRKSFSNPRVSIRRVYEFMRKKFSGQGASRRTDIFCDSRDGLTIMYWELREGESLLSRAEVYWKIPELVGGLGNG